MIKFLILVTLFAVALALPLDDARVRRNSVFDHGGSYGYGGYGGGLGYSGYQSGYGGYNQGYGGYGGYSGLGYSLGYDRGYGGYHGFY